MMELIVSSNTFRIKLKLYMHNNNNNNRILLYVAYYTIFYACHKMCTVIYKFIPVNKAFTGSKLDENS